MALFLLDAAAAASHTTASGTVRSATAVYETRFGMNSSRSTTHLNSFSRLGGRTPSKPGRSTSRILARTLAVLAAWAGRTPMRRWPQGIGARCRALIPPRERSTEICVRRVCRDANGLPVLGRSSRVVYQTWMQAGSLTDSIATMCHSLKLCTFTWTHRRPTAAATQPSDSGCNCWMRPGTR